MAIGSEQQPPPADRISELPDDVLCKILSLLPTKFAAVTSVLSTRWKFLFTSVVDIDLSDNLFLKKQRDHTITSEAEEKLVNLGYAERFVQFVSRLLFRDRDSISIFKFRLRCYTQHDKSTINSWILSVLPSNVRELDIWVKTDENSVLPDEIFTCKTLEILKLGMNFNLRVPESVSLSNLKYLNLDFLRLNSHRFLPTVLSGCPVLEDLRIHSCKLIDFDVIEIRHPRIKYLLIMLCESQHYFILDAPNLQNLLYATRGDTSYVVNNTNSLVHADIRWGSDTIVLMLYDRGVKYYSAMATHFINAMHNASSLYLSACSLSALYISGVPLATFNNLTVMELGVHHICGWKLLPQLLRSSPNLEVLIFDEGFLDRYGPENKVNYLLPETIPICLSRSVREIKIGEFHGQEVEFELIEYFLKSAQVLRMMVIGPEVSSESPFGFQRRSNGRTYFGDGVPPEWLMPTCTRLSAASKCSMNCEIVLSWKIYRETHRLTLGD